MQGWHFARCLAMRPARHGAVALAVAAALGIAMGGMSAYASDGTWNSGTGLWSESAKWTGGVADGAGATAWITNEITAASAITIDGAVTSRTLGTLQIGDANATHAFTIDASGGGTLTLNNNGAGARIVQVGTSKGDTISAPILLADAITLTNASANAATLSGAISGSGAVTLFGSWSLTSINNAFTGNLVAVNGTLATGTTLSGADSYFGYAANAITLSNATLSFGRAFLLSPRRTINGNAATISSGSVYAHISGSILGTGGLTLDGGGTKLGFLFSGSNNWPSATLYGWLRFGSESGLGGPTSALTFRDHGTDSTTLSILGNSVHALSGHAFTWTSNPRFQLDIQDADQTFTWDKSNNSGNYFNKLGLGTLVVATSQTYNVATAGNPATYVGGGVLKVDYAAGGSLYGPAVNSNNRIAFVGGTLYILGKGGALSTTQHLGHVQLGTGGGGIVVDNQGGSGNTVLNLGTFTNLAPSAGGSLSISTVNAGGGAVVTTTQGNDTSGIVGAGHVVVNGTNFATAVGAGPTYSMGGYSGATAGLGDTSASSTVNYAVAGSPAAPATDLAANTLSLLSSGGGQGVDLNAKTLALTSGGLLFAGAADYVISNGLLKSVASGTSDLVIHHYGAGRLVLGAAITNGNGASTLTVAGTGTVVLASQNRYTGPTYVNGACLSISHTNQLSPAALNLSAGTLQATADLTWIQTVTLLGGGGTFNVAGGKTVTLGGAVNGTPNDNAGRLALTGGGSLVLTQANAFASGVWINGGTLRLGHSSALGTMGLNTLSFGPAAGASMLQLNGARTIAVAGLSDAYGSAVVENGSNATVAALQVHNGADNTFAGILRDGSGTLGLVKGGAGRLVLTGANTFTGTTTVNGGPLVVNGSLAAGSAVTINGGALGGTGTVAGAVTVANGGTLGLGDPALHGTLTTGNLTLQEGARVACGISGGTADRVAVNGTLTLPSTATVMVSSNGPLPSSAILFSATTLAGAGTLSGWTVSNTNLSVRLDGTTVILQVGPRAGTIVLLR